MRLVCYQPEIPQNVGALLRLSSCWGIAMDFVGPFPFLWSDRHLKRSGMDYCASAIFTCHNSWAAYKKTRLQTSGIGRLIGLVAQAPTCYLNFSFLSNDHLLLGSESCGLPEQIQNTDCDVCLSIPMCDQRRSLNMAMSGAIVLSEALRQSAYWPL